MKPHMSVFNGGSSVVVVTDPAKSNDMNNRHLGVHNASKPMVTRESVCQQVRKSETIGALGDKLK